MGIRAVIKKLFDKGFISENTSTEEDFDLLPLILKKREIEQNRKLKKGKEKNSEIDAFIEILEEDLDIYTESELLYLYNSIFEVEEN